jgi:hypothetical protein
MDAKQRANSYSEDENYLRAFRWCYALAWRSAKIQIDMKSGASRLPTLDET